MIQGRFATRLLALLGSALGIAFAAWFLDRYWPQKLPPFSNQALPQTDVESGRLAIRVRGSQLVGELSQYDDELFAYLMFDYLRSRKAFLGMELLLTQSHAGQTIAYSIRVVLPNDLSRGCSRLYELATGFPFLDPGCLFVHHTVLAAERLHTGALVRAYNYGTYRKLEQLSDREVIAYARRFIRFKSHTDPRIRRQIQPVPHPLSRQEAQELAADIVAVAQFYSLPLDFFLGIGAMENNYMNIKGDLGHAVWKRRVEKGDVILQRRAGRVLVLNEAIGGWQITRETLRYTHELFLRDQRDYSALPEHLRPPRDLDIEGLEASVLTTYAGLLFRDLLDRFNGDLAKAVGAYNGGPGNPNQKYAAGVELVAQYARKIMEAAAYVRAEHSLERRNR